MKDRDDKVYRRLGPNVGPLIRKMQRLHRQCSYHSLIHYYCSPRLDNACRDGGEMSLESERETSKVFTQKEVSTITSGTSAVGSQETFQDEDTIRHHTPHHKVHALGSGLKEGDRVRLRVHQNDYTLGLFRQ